MNSYQFQEAIFNLHQEVSGEIRDIFPENWEEEEKNKVLKKINNCFNKILVTNDFANVKAHLLVSSEKKISRENVKERIKEIVGEKNLEEVYELKNERSAKSNFKVELKKTPSLEDGTKVFPVAKFFKNIASSNKDNKGDKIFGSPFIPKSGLAQSTEINKLAKKIRSANNDKRKLYTRIKLDYKESKIILMVKRDGAENFVELSEAKKKDAEKEWLEEYKKIKAKEITYIKFVPKNLQNQN